MDPEQKHIIQTRMCELVRTIKCSKAFLAHFVRLQVLDEEEVEYIDSERTNQCKISSLLGQLKCRTGSFDALCTALRETTQIEPLKLLLPNETFVLNANSKAGWRFANEVTVGDEDCPVPRIVTIVQDDPNGTLIQPALGELARRLWISLETRNQILQSLQTGNIDLYDAIERLLSTWLANSSNERAKLSVLLEAPEKCNLESIAERIRTQLEIKTGSPDEETGGN